MQYNVNYRNKIILPPPLADVGESFLSSLFSVTVWFLRKSSQSKNLKKNNNFGTFSAPTPRGLKPCKTMFNPKIEEAYSKFSCLSFIVQIVIHSSVPNFVWHYRSTDDLNQFFINISARVQKRSLIWVCVSFSSF